MRIPSSGRVPHNTTRVYGIKFDSKAEAGRYLELRQQLKRGEISDLILQPKFDLIPTGRVPHRKALRAHSYTADFQYVRDGKIVVEDVKSAYTRKHRDYIINRKLMWFLKGIYVEEVIR